jgi:hypothetical protein
MLYLKTVARLLIISFICSGVVFDNIPTAQATATGIPSTIELDGYMWSSTIGWISLNCKTGSATSGDICGTGTGKSDYRVVIATNGNVTGYAWSSNIGWIRFGGLGSYPVDAGNPEVTPGVNQARVEGTYSDTNPVLTFAGWARACAGLLNPGTSCSNMASRTDGWDGWISLKGSNYQLRFDNDHSMIVYKESGSNSTDGFFWGSTVVGWIGAHASMNWSGVSGILTGNDCSIPHGSSTCNVTIGWTFTPSSITSPAVNQTAINQTPQILVNNINTSAGKTGTPLSGSKSVPLYNGANQFKMLTGSTVLKTYTYNAGCADANDYFSTTTNKCEYNPGLPPNVSFSATPKFIRSGDIVTLSWTVTGVPDMSVCKLTGPQAPNMTATTPRSTTWTTPKGLTSYSTYALNCTTATGTDSGVVNIEVVPTVIEN